MKIFVPKYLRKLGVLGNLCDAVNEYSASYNESVEDYSNDLFLIKIDPVKRFINLCLSGDDYSVPHSYSYHETGNNEVTTEDQDPNEILKNLTHLFYSVSGTYKVLEYMEKYLKLDFDGTPNYTASSISFTLGGIIGNDLAIFEEYLNSFLDALLYFEKLDYNIKNTDLEIKITSRIKGTTCVETYKKFEIDAKI